MIVPSGIATDDTTKVFFADLVDRRSLVSLYDFENREKVFPGIDSRIKFCLLTLSGADRPSPQAEFAFFLYRAEQLQDADGALYLLRKTSPSSIPTPAPAPYSAPDEMLTSQARCTVVPACSGKSHRAMSQV